MQGTTVVDRSFVRWAHMILRCDLLHLACRAARQFHPFTGEPIQARPCPGAFVETIRPHLLLKMCCRISDTIVVLTRDISSPRRNCGLIIKSCHGQLYVEYDASSRRRNPKCLRAGKLAAVTNSSAMVVTTRKEVDGQAAHLNFLCVPFWRSDSFQIQSGIH
jgi:hypothetical protein